MAGRFSRTEMLIGKEALTRLARSTVVVFGIGGVGSAATEALARAGIGTLHLVDDDTVGITNINRQLVALTSTVGKPKAEAMAERVRDINPDATVIVHRTFFLPETSGSFDFASFDYVLDCVDTVTAKLEIIRSAKEAHTPVISCMGTANKLDPTAFSVADIERTSICPLARIIRKEARKRSLGHFKCVFSTEPAISPAQPQDLASELRQGSSARSLPASISFVPPVAGFIMASEVIRDLCDL